VYYAPLAEQPGFIAVLADLIAELKAAQIWPDRLARAAQDLGAEPRLLELARVYAAYQQRLQAYRWADRAGLGWLAVEALAERAPDVARDWSLLIVDGFDDLTRVQLALLQLLGARVKDMVVTLTGSPDRTERPHVHQRFVRTRQLIEEALGVRAAPLPNRAPTSACPCFIWRARCTAQRRLRCSERCRRAAGGARSRCRGQGCAALAQGAPGHRWSSPCRGGSAGPFHIPISCVCSADRSRVRAAGTPRGGSATACHPAVAALLDLLRLVLPRSVGGSELALPRRLVIEAWRSPYLDWASALGEGACTPGMSHPAGICPRDANTLDAVARWGRVVAGSRSGRRSWMSSSPPRMERKPCQPQQAPPMMKNGGSRQPFPPASRPDHL